MIKTKILSTKAEAIGERTVRFKISSEVVDRDGDILIAAGCDTVNFMKNPVFLPFHKQQEFPLGKVMTVFIEANAVYADVYFPTIEELSTDKANPSEKAKLVDFTYHCYKNGMLNAVSVGFIAKNFEEIYDEDHHFTGYKVIQWELLEFSAVAVPANQEALAQAVKSFGVNAQSIMVMFKDKKNDGQQPKPESENETIALLRACNDRVKVCEEEIKTLESTVKECLTSIKEVLKTVKGEDILDVDENPEQTNNNNEDDVLVIS